MISLVSSLGSWFLIPKTQHSFAFYQSKVYINVCFYLKKESTNSCLLNTCKSSMPSPTPIYFTGILN